MPDELRVPLAKTKLVESFDLPKSFHEKKSNSNDLES